MIDFRGILETVKGHFESIEELSDIKFLYDFPSQKQDLPLRGTIVTMGINSINILPTEEHGFVDAGFSPCDVTIKMLICVPKAQSGYDCYNALERVMDHSDFIIATYTVLDIRAEKMRFDSTVCGLVLPIYIKLQMDNAY